MTSKASFRDRFRKLGRYPQAFLIMAYVFVPLGAYAMLVPSMLGQPNAYTETTSPDLYSYQEERRVEVWLEVNDFDAQTEALQYRFALRPAFPFVGLPLSNSLIVPPGTNLRVTHSNFGNNTEKLMLGGYTYPSIEGRIATEPFPDASLQNYPFDAYRGQMLIRGWIEDAGAQTDEIVAGSSDEVIQQAAAVWGPMQLEYRYPGQVAPPETFSLAISRTPRMALIDDSVDAFDQAQIQDDVERGFYALNILLIRDEVTQTIALSLGILFLSLAGVSVVLFLTILAGHKPTSLLALIWVNSLIFTTIVARGALPGDPPIGIRLDIQTYFPSLLLLTVSAVGTAVLWIVRRDAISR